MKPSLTVDTSSSYSPVNSNNKSSNSNSNEETLDDPNHKYTKSSSASTPFRRLIATTIINMSNLLPLLSRWKSFTPFWKAQVQVAVILVIAYIGNAWPHSYPRNDNHNMNLFWFMNVAIFVAALATLKHVEPRSGSNGAVQLLSRAQTEEWKGWMQWAFIMYHYYRAYSVYNEIRVFVSAYVWMTGFGNFLYFDKKKDFSIERAISMWIRINYFPLLLSWGLGVPLELYYVVPLHTAGFFITMATCYVASLLQQHVKLSHDQSNGAAIALCLLVHILFYETKAVDLLLFFSKEYHFRFQSDKYSAWVGILSGLYWSKFSAYMQWCYNTAPELQTVWHTAAPWIQRGAGIGLMLLWYFLFGHINDKYTYNPMHPYVFWMPVAGWLMLRNSSKYLTQLHADALEFFGRITLETYVLQFHVFMCNQVQHIPVVIPGATADGPGALKFLNMLVCGVIFVALAYWARQVTVTTQESLTELVALLRHGPPPSEDDNNDDDNEALLSTEKVPMSDLNGNKNGQVKHAHHSPSSNSKEEV